MTTLTYNIPSVHCDHCQMTIEREMTEMEGVNLVQVDIEGRQAVIEFAPPATDSAIKSLLGEIGYPPEELISL